MNFTLGNNEYVMDIAGGTSHTIILTTKGKVYGVGSGAYLGLVATTPKVFTDLGFTNVTHIACSAYNTIIVVNSKIIYVIGRSYDSTFSLNLKEFTKYELPDIG